MREEALDLRFGSGPRTSLKRSCLHTPLSASALLKSASVEEAQLLSRSVWYMYIYR